MVSRSVFNVRRLIPQRHTEGDGLDFSDISDADGVNRSANKEKDADRGSKKQKGGHWTASRKSSRTKNSPPKPIVIRRSGSVHRVSISSPLPLPPDTPHSSTSSLCSCEHHHGRGQSPRPVPPAKTSPGLSSLRSAGSNDQSSPRLPSLGYRQRSASSSSTTIQIKHVADAMMKAPSPPQTTLDLLEALSIQPERPVTPPTSLRLERRVSPHSHVRTTPSVGRSDDVSENVQQLIRETDKAFEEVGLALTAPIFSARESSDQEIVVSPTFTQPRTPPPTAGRSSSSPKLHPRGGPVVLSAPRRKSSVSKPKRKGSKKQKSRLEIPKAKATASKHTARWTLSENVSDLLNVRLFNRLEVDEIRTPEQLQAITQKRNSQALSDKARLSSETARTAETTQTLETDGSETPIEPFHLQDLPQRIGAAGVRLSVLGPVAERSTTSLPEQRPEPPKREAPPVPTIKQDTPCVLPEENMKLKDIPFLAPPAKNPLRLLSRHKTPADLSPIPELKVTAPEGKTKPASISVTAASTASSSSSSRASPPAAVTKETDEFLFLGATPFSLTRPDYRHGPIRLAKSDIAALLDASAAEDVLSMSNGETLDWTAFQIAIGGVDFTNSDPEDDEVAEDVAAWFHSLGFAHAGRLETSPPPPTPPPTYDGSPTSQYSQAGSPPPSSSAPSSSSSPSSFSSAAASPQEMQERRREENLPIPVDLEVELPSLSPGNNSWSPGDDELLSVEPERFYRTVGSGGPGVKHWVLPGHHQPGKPYLSQRQQCGSGSGDNGASPAGSEDSLPMSPMQDLVMIHGSGGGSRNGGRGRGTVGEGYVVPMGYNLGHDLGDFLQWEAQYMHTS